MNVTLVRNLAFCCFFVTSAEAPASERTWADLLQDCRSVEESRDSAPAYRCIHYIRGFLDATHLRQRAEPGKIVSLPFGSRVARMPSGTSGRYCIHPEIPVEDIIKILLGSPEREQVEPATSAAELLERLLVAHYPCNP